MASLMDVLPTLAAGSPHSTYYYFNGTRIHGVRAGSWKLHLYARAPAMLRRANTRKMDPPELYNLDEDPGERFNVAKENPRWWQSSGRWPRISTGASSGASFRRRFMGSRSSSLEYRGSTALSPESDNCP
jgi:hypothetical protein